MVFIRIETDGNSRIALLSKHELREISEWNEVFPQVESPPDPGGAQGGLGGTPSYQNEWGVLHNIAKPGPHKLNGLYGKRQASKHNFSVPTVKRTPYWEILNVFHLHRIHQWKTGIWKSRENDYEPDFSSSCESRKSFQCLSWKFFPWSRFPALTPERCPWLDLALAASESLSSEIYLSYNSHPHNLGCQSTNAINELSLNHVLKGSPAQALS